MKMILGKINFFHLKNALENILQSCAKDKAKRVGVRRAFLENGLRKNLV